MLSFVVYENISHSLLHRAQEEKVVGIVSLDEGGSKAS
jgi:hypothetical protein